MTAQTLPRSARPKPIDAEVLAVLRSMHWPSESVCKIPGHCDIYARVKKVLEALGGKWSRAEQATVFSGDGITLVRDAIELGQYINMQQAWQFFQTPVWLARKMIDTIVEHLRAHYKTGDVDGWLVLEPSAGKGRIVKELLDASFYVTAIELNREHMADLSTVLMPYGPQRGSVACLDFLQYKPDFLVDAVCMNPPFTRLQDVLHVRHAYQFLKPGGILMAVMSTGWTFRTNNNCRDFMDFIGDIEGKWQRLPDDTFKDEGTGVCATLVTLQKPV